MIKYPKIHRLGKEETDGILLFPLVVQEKIDGANSSIWIDGELKMSSRNNELQSGFNGFCDYVRKHEGISRLLEDNPSFVLYGEWLVRHTIHYNESSYSQWYMFDILEDGKFLDQEEVQNLAVMYGISYPTIFYEGMVNDEVINEYLGKSTIGEHGEGLVLKSTEFVNKFGDPVYAKVVTQKFKEDNALVFGGNNKHSETYWEMYIVNKYCTLARVRKIIMKIESEVGKLDFKDTPRIAGTCYHDMITEEAWEIAGKVGFVNFKRLKTLANKKFIQIYHDVLNNHISVSYETHNDALVAGER